MRIAERLGTGKKGAKHVSVLPDLFLKCPSCSVMPGACSRLCCITECLGTALHQLWLLRILLPPCAWARRTISFLLEEVLQHSQATSTSQGIPLGHSSGTHPQRCPVLCTAAPELSSTNFSKVPEQATRRIHNLHLLPCAKRYEREPLK